MGNRRNISHRLSASNQYYSEKKRKKLGPVGKILLVAIGILAVGLFIYEINSTGSQNNPAHNADNTPGTTLSEKEQLEQQYQELLKSGQKYTGTERADSIKKAAIKIVEQEKKDNQITPSIQRPASNTKPKVTTTTKKPKPKPSTNTQRNTSTATTTGKPIVANTPPSSNEPVEEVYYPAQSISGMITSASDGEGLSGVNVMIKGGSQSTVTDYKGAYNIDLAAGPGPRVLQFNYQGNRIEREVIPGRNTINAKF